jgi:NADH-quinone oxidoreductase subunit L
MLYGEFFKNVIFVGETHHAMEELRREFHGPFNMAIASLSSPTLWLAIAGVVSSYYFYMVKPSIPAAIKRNFYPLYALLDNKYYLDKLNDIVFAGGARLLGGGLWNVGDRGLIDGLIVNGSAKAVGWFSKITRLWQSGYIYHYAFVMIIGVLGFLVWFMPFPFAK